MIGGKTIFTGLAILGLFVSGYGYGRSSATNKYKAVIAEIESNYAKEEQFRYQAIAEAERESRMRLQKETERGNSIAKQLGDAKQELVKELLRAKGKNTYVSKNALEYCSGMPNDWVQSYNKALGLTSTSNPHPNTNTFKTPSDTRSSQTFDTRLQQSKINTSQSDQELAIEVPLHKQEVNKDYAWSSSNALPEKLATPQDILLHLQHYGAYCQSVAMQLQALVKLLEKEQ